jgi:hypothetical protein
MYGAAAPPNLVGGGSREDLVGMELLGVGWCLHRSRSGGICAGGEFWSLVPSPPPLPVLPGGVLGALVAISAVWRAIPRWRR